LSTLVFLLAKITALGLWCHLRINLENDNRFVVLLSYVLQTKTE